MANLKETSKQFISLSNNQVIELFTNFKLTEIADMYNVTAPFISEELKDRDLFNPENTKRIPSEYELDFSIGAWMNSKERIAINQYNKL